MAELAALQDQVTPLTEAEVVEVMEQELGVPWEDVFASIEPEPLAAGTIGQVHRAVLEDGERVVVKVQRPNAKEDILRDLSLLELFAEKTAGRSALRQLVDIPAAIEHLSDSLRRELDFKLEAENVERLRAALGHFPRLGAPRVIEQLTTSRLLVLEEIQGVPVRDAPPELERTEVARELLEFYYRQILVEGFFHADPHPGNLLCWNGRVYFLDFGMVGELTPEMRGHLLLLLLAFWQEDVSFLTEVVLIMAGPEAENADAAGLETDLGELLRRYRHSSLGEIQLGPLLQEIAQSSTRHGVRLPVSLVLTGKALAQMQLTVSELDPELDPFSVVGRFLMRNLITRARAGVEPKRLFYDVLEAEGARRAADRVVRANQRRAAGPPVPGRRAGDLAAGAHDSRRGAPGRARRHGRLGARRHGRHRGRGARRELGADHARQRGRHLRGAAAARSFTRGPPLAALRERAADAPLEKEREHAHQAAQDRALEPTSHAASLLLQLEARYSAKIEPGAAAALDDADHDGVAVATAHDDPGADVDVQAGHLLARAATSRTCRAWRSGRRRRARRAGRPPHCRPAGAPRCRSSRRSEALGPDPACGS